MNELRSKLQELFALLPPSQGISAKLIALYLDRLLDLPTAVVCDAIDRLILTSRFTPTVAEIREAAAVGPFGPELGDEAWTEVLREVKRVGYNRLPTFRDGKFEPAPAPEFSTPLIAAAVASVGWEAICTSDKPEVIRSQFVKAFAALQGRETRAKQTGVAALDDRDDERPAIKAVS